MLRDALAPEALNADPPGIELWRATVSGLCATLVGIGLARFAYTPLLPAIIQAHWFSAADAGYLGAANLTGYLAGALLAGPVAARASAPAVLRAMMLLTSIALLACAWPVNFLWFFGWRLASGLGGGVLMVLAAPTVLAHVQPARRGIASGMIFMGIGLGIASSGSLVPLLLRQGLMQTWSGLAALSFALTALAWHAWPTRPAALPPRPARAPGGAASPAGTLHTLYATYALNAVGLVPHMIFLVDFVARGLGRGVAAGSGYWVLFGAGAVCGPLVGGLVADRLGFRLTLRLAFVLQALAAGLPALQASPAWLAVSCIVMGAFTPGIVGLVLGRLNELLPHQPAAQKYAWARATTGFAIFQAASAYGMSWLLVQIGGRHALLFMLGAAALLLALAIDLAAGTPGRPSARISPSVTP